MHRLLKLTIAAIAVFGHTSASYSYEHIGEKCDKQGYVVAYVNGVNTNWADAYTNLLHMSDSLGIDAAAVAQGETVNYELFYNTTGADADDSAYEKLVAQWIERDDNLRKITKQHWEVFRSFVDEGGRDEGPWRSLKKIYTEAVPSFGPYFLSFLKEYSNRSIASLTKLVSNPPKASPVSRHTARMKALALEGKKILLFAHSQGNVYVEPLLEAAVSIKGFSKDNISAIHLAPPMIELNGPYVLADKDEVIAGIRIIGQNKVPAPTHQISDSHLKDVDPTGHRFIDTYLDDRLEVLGSIRRIAGEQLQRLRDPNTAGRPGLFTVSMVWDRNSDIDLHAFEPSNTHVYYSSTKGKNSHLDVGSDKSTIPEHYYAFCEESKIGLGSYRIGVNNFRGDENTRVTVQVSSLFDGVLFTKEAYKIGPVRGSSGDKSPQPIVNVEVLKNANGQYDVKIR